MAEAFEIQHVQQHSPHGCVQACCAMVSGRSLEEVLMLCRRDGGGLSGRETDRLLVRLGIMPRYRNGEDIRPGRIYLVQVPSLNIRGGMHMIVLDSRADPLVFDPNTGREGVETYDLGKIRGWGDLIEVEHCTPAGRPLGGSE